MFCRRPTTWPAEEFRTALSLARQDREVAEVIRELVTAGLEDQALPMIDSLLDAVSDPAPLRYQRGIIFEKNKRYALAAGEYMAVLWRHDPRLAANAEKRLLDLLRFEESSETVERSLMVPADSIHSVRALKLLSDYYLSENSFSRAFELALRQDQLEGANGEVLSRYMRSCRDRRQPAEAARTGEYILENYGDISTMIRVLFMLAEAQTELGEYRKAIAAYDTIVVRSPQMRDKSEALCQIGIVYLDRLNDPERAAACFRLGRPYLQAGRRLSSLVADSPVLRSSQGRARPGGRHVPRAAGLAHDRRGSGGDQLSTRPD